MSMYFFSFLFHFASSESGHDAHGPTKAVETQTLFFSLCAIRGYEYNNVEIQSYTQLSQWGHQLGIGGVLLSCLIKCVLDSRHRFAAPSGLQCKATLTRKSRRRRWEMWSMPPSLLRCRCPKWVRGCFDVPENFYQLSASTRCCVQYVCLFSLSCWGGIQGVEITLWPITSGKEALNFSYCVVSTEVMFCINKAEEIRV